MSRGQGDWGESGGKDTKIMRSFLPFLRLQVWFPALQPGNSQLPLTHVLPNSFYKAPTTVRPKPGKETVTTKRKLYKNIPSDPRLENPQ